MEEQKKIVDENENEETVDTKSPTEENEEKKTKEKDKPLLALNIFSLFFFLIALIIYLAQKKKYPNQMEALKPWLIVSFILRVAIAIFRAVI